MAHRSRWCLWIFAGRWAAQGSAGVIGHLLAVGGVGGGEVLLQHRRQVGNQEFPERGRQVLPAWERGAAGRRCRRGARLFGGAVGTWIAILPESQALLAPACQFQESRSTYYRLRRGCDNSS